MSYAAKQLAEIFKKVEVTVAYNPEWENGTGYFDSAVDHELPELSWGERWKSVDPSGRKIVGVKTPFGNVVVFDRYSGDERQYVVNNVPNALRGVVRPTAMTEHEILSTLGYFDFDNNIGKALAKAFELGKNSK